MGPIILSGQLSADNSDILSGTRLQTVPAGGVLTFELSASACDATNFATATIQLPSGDTPMESVLVPAAAAGGQLDERTEMKFSAIVGQGGHTVFAIDITATVQVMYRVTYTPA